MSHLYSQGKLERERERDTREREMQDERDERESDNCGRKCARDREGESRGHNTMSQDSAFWVRQRL